MDGLKLYLVSQKSSLSACSKHVRAFQNRDAWTLPDSLDKKL